MSPLGAGLLGFVVGAAVVWIVDAIDHAPEGWQDETTGTFHYGKRPDPDEHPEEWAEWEDPRA